MHAIKKEAKIINDPIYGFVQIDKGIIYNLIEHPFFQRLRRISQLGLAYLVYPGAYHTRFHHALGCLFLMNRSIEQIRKKGHIITNKEAEAVKIAILLHDIGHGPFSHALEKSIVSHIKHEKISLLYMQELNRQYKGKLSLAIKIFRNKYKKKFLHQLVSSQLDMDRLDYLNRDSFYSGVQEGVIGTERIINMLNIVDDNLVIEEKGTYSIEKFLIARRLMYWQVYLHKTVLSAENTLIKVLKRAKELINEKKYIFTTPALLFFLENNITKNKLEEDNSLLRKFAELDDHDIYTCLKQWINNKDIVISKLSDSIVNRRLLKVKISNKPFSKKLILEKKKSIMRNFGININLADYFVFSDKISNRAYFNGKSDINILLKDGSIRKLRYSSDLNLGQVLSKKIDKFFLCFLT